MKVVRVEIPVASNKEIPFLYNKASEILTKNKSSGKISNQTIIIDRVNRNGLKELKDAGIKFFIG